MSHYFKSLTHPDELWALLTLRYQKPSHEHMLSAPATVSFCYECLQEVSWGTYVVLQQLPGELKDAGVVLTLAMCALRSVERDTSIPTDYKLYLLRTFHEHIMTPGWSMNSGSGYEKNLLENFDKVVDMFLGLCDRDRDHIRRLVRDMGEGLTQFVGTDIVSIEDYDAYTRVSAGFAGECLRNLLDTKEAFVREDSALFCDVTVFIEKCTNIRHISKAVSTHTARWPRQVWSEHVADLESLCSPHAQKGAVQCVNHMVADALRHVPSCIQLLEKVGEGHELFLFCATGIVMALEALAQCYGSKEVLYGDIVVRRGRAAKIIVDTKDMEGMYGAFYECAQMISSNVHPQDPTAGLTQERAERVLALSHPRSPVVPFSFTDLMALLSLGSSAAYLLQRHSVRFFSKM